MAKKTQNNDVQQHINNIKKFLIEKYTTINDEWLLSLQMLEMNLTIFFDCKERIKKDGMMITNRFGVLEKHPLLKVQVDSQIQIIKLMNEFGLTPKSSSKLKQEETDNSDDFIKALTS